MVTISGLPWCILNTGDMMSKVKNGSKKLEQLKQLLKLFVSRLLLFDKKSSCLLLFLFQNNF